jgi:hypothetical protein
VKLTPKQNKWLGGIVAAVIAGLIVEWTKDFPFLKWLIRAIRVAIDWLVQPVTLPLWVVLLLSGAVGGTVISLGLGHLRTASSSALVEAYNTDFFFGIKWHWRYLDGQVLEHSIAAVCPSCSYQMVMARGSASILEPRTLVLCEDCKYQQEFEGGGDDVIRRVLLAVQRNLRTGKYLEITTGSKS